MGTDKKANTLWQPISDVSCPFPCRVRPLCHSVCSNNITGDAANHLATVVLEHAAMTDFCGIPLASLRENSITEQTLARAAAHLRLVICVPLRMTASSATPLSPRRLFSRLRAKGRRGNGER